MSDQRISELTELTEPSDGDYVAVAHDDNGSMVSRRVKLGNMLGGGGGAESGVIWTPVIWDTFQRSDRDLDGDTAPSGQDWKVQQGGVSISDGEADPSSDGVATIDLPGGLRLRDRNWIFRSVGGMCFYLDNENYIYFDTDGSSWSFKAMERVDGTTSELASRWNRNVSSAIVIELHVEERRRLRVSGGHGQMSGSLMEFDDKFGDVTKVGTNPDSSVRTRALYVAMPETTP